MNLFGIKIKIQAVLMVSGKPLTSSLNTHTHTHTHTQHRNKIQMVLFILPGV